jgi:trigger factor
MDNLDALKAAVRDQIGRLHHLQVTDEEMYRGIFAEAQRHPGQDQLVLADCQQNPQAAQNLAGPVFEDKVIDFILEMATVNDNVISVEDLYKADDEEAKPAKKTAKKAAKKAAAKKTATKAAAKKSAAKKKD